MGRGAPLTPLRPVADEGDEYGSHRVVTTGAAVLPQAAERLDADFQRLFRGEVLIAVETLNIDAASFRQIEEQAEGDTPEGSCLDDAVAHIVARTVEARGKQHNPVTGSGGMLLGRVLQVAPGRPDVDDVAPGDRIATLVSLTSTPLCLRAVHRVRRATAQLDVEGEAVIFASSPYARLPDDFPERLALAALDVAGAAPQVARLVRPGDLVVVLGGAGKSGVL